MYVYNTCNYIHLTAVFHKSGSADARGQLCLSHPRTSAGRNGLAMTRLTAVWEAAASYVYHDSHCDVQPWARTAHPSCSA